MFDSNALASGHCLCPVEGKSQFRGSRRGRSGILSHSFLEIWEFAYNLRTTEEQEKERKRPDATPHKARRFPASTATDQKVEFESLRAHHFTGATQRRLGALSWLKEARSSLMKSANFPPRPRSLSCVFCRNTNSNASAELVRSERMFA
jgi:hypothetical protein